MVVVENRIEDQVVASDSLSTIDGIVCEQQNIALSQVSVHHDSALRNRARLVQKPGEQQRLLFAKPQNDLRTVLHWNHLEIVARLVFVELFGLPRLLLRHHVRFRNLAALSNINVIRPAAARGAMLIGIHQHTAAPTRERIADVEHHSIRAYDRKTRPIAIGDWARRRNEDAIENTSHNVCIIVRSDADTPARVLYRWQTAPYLHTNLLTIRYR